MVRRHFPRTVSWLPHLRWNRRGRTLAVLLSGFLLASAAALVSNDHGRPMAGPPSQPGSDPVWFEPNVGQADPGVAYVARTRDGMFLLSPTELVLARPGGVVRSWFEGANTQPRIEGVDQMSGRVNYLRGADRSAWRTDVPTFGKVRYQSIYPGIDAIYYSKGGDIEYDLVVAPGADPSEITMRLAGPSRIHLDDRGDLVLGFGDGDVRHRSPVAYQTVGHESRPVDASFRLAEDGRVTFTLGAYDRSLALVIDPLIYSTYLGGSGIDRGTGIAVDGAGNAYIVGQTSSTDFPVTGTPPPPKPGGDDVVVVKLNSTGTALVYSTYLGGSAADLSGDIAVDGSGNAYVSGATMSTDFPLVSPFQSTIGGGRDGFVAKLNPTGSDLLYSSYLGGSDDDEAPELTLDGAGNVFVAGTTRSTDFPIAGSPFQASFTGDPNSSSTGSDVFIAKVAPNAELVYSSYLGGSRTDLVSSIVVDASGHLYITGITGSTDFPVAGSPFQATGRGGPSYVAKFTPDGSRLVYSTYLSGSSANVAAADIAVDASGNAYVVGYTSASDFPIAGSPFQSTFNGGLFDGFVTKLNPSGSSLVFSTYLGGTGDDSPLGVALDSNGVIHITGDTKSDNFPTVNPIQPFKRALGDVFVSHLEASGSELSFSTFLGSSNSDSARGIAVDSDGNDYLTGVSSASDFPLQNPVQAVYGGGVFDAIVVKLRAGATGTTSTVPPSTTTTVPPPATTVAGAAFYSDGTSARTGPSGARVSVFATRAEPGFSYRLVSGRGTVQRPCSSDVMPINDTPRFANAQGVISQTAGMLTRPAGEWQICFLAEGQVVTGATTYTVTG